MVMDIVICEISMVKVWSWRLHGSNCGLHFEEYSYLIIHLCITVTVTWILLSNTKKKKTILAGHLYPVFSFLFPCFSFQIRCPNPTWVLDLCPCASFSFGVAKSDTHIWVRFRHRSCAHVMLQRSITQPCWPSAVSCSGHSLAIWSNLYYINF